MHMDTCFRLAALMSVTLLGACAHGDWVEAPKPMELACLGYSRPCANIPVRPPVTKTLTGSLDGDPERGRQIAFARDKGNCLACHAMAGGTQTGTRGPDLTHYGATGRTDGDTFTMVYDMRVINPDTLMPPIGTNAILTEEEIRDVVAFLQASR